MSKTNLVLMNQLEEKPSDQQVAEAISTLIKWIGEDPTREGLAKTPARVIESYKKLFSGYKANIAEILDCNFNKTSEFKDLILLKDIKFTSFCEHHLLPMTGTVSISYIPKGGVVGLSRIAKLVDAFAKRLQIQERFTSQIAQAIDHHLKPKGVAVAVRAYHQCMSIRDVHQDNVEVYTDYMLRDFKKDKDLKSNFLSLISKR